MRERYEHPHSNRTPQPTPCTNFGGEEGRRRWGGAKKGEGAEVGAGRLCGGLRDRGLGQGLFMFSEAGRSGVNLMWGGCDTHLCREKKNNFFFAEKWLQQPACSASANSHCNVATW